jgi:FAD/FMN-containing dehydrogenase
VLVDALSAGSADTILEHLETATAPMAAVHLRVLGGAVARVADDATAFGHRGAKLMVNVAVMYQRPEERSEHETWAAGVVAALSEGAAERAYVGFVGDEGQEGARRACPPETMEHLAEVKRRYDPDNLFHRNLNVLPNRTR